MGKLKVHCADFANLEDLRQIGSFSALEELVIEDDSIVVGHVYFERLDPAEGNSGSSRLGNCQYTLLQRTGIYDISPRNVCFSVGRSPSADFNPCNGQGNVTDSSVSREQGVIIVTMFDNVVKVWFKDFNNGNGVFGVKKETLARVKLEGRLVSWNPGKGYIAFGMPPEANKGTEFKSVPRYRINYSLFE